MVAGYNASNPTRNVQIPGGLRFYFRRTGDTNFEPVGAISDVQATPEVTEFIFNSTYDGISTEAKRLVSSVSLSFSMTLNEINVPNLRHIFLANAEATGSINIVSDTAPTRTSAGTFVLPEAGGDIVSVTSVRSEDGETEYTVTTDYTVSGNTITIVSSSSLDTASPNEGDRIHVLYTVAMPGASTRSVEMMQDTQISGAAQFHVRNQDGGLAQIYELDAVVLTPSGSVPFAVDANQTLPLQVSVQESGGNYGRIYMRDIT